MTLLLLEVGECLGLARGVRVMGRGRGGRRARTVSSLEAIVPSSQHTPSSTSLSLVLRPRSTQHVPKPFRPDHQRSRSTFPPPSLSFFQSDTPSLLPSVPEEHHDLSFFSNDPPLSRSSALLSSLMYPSAQKTTYLLFLSRTHALCPAHRLSHTPIRYQHPP